MSSLLSGSVDYLTIQINDDTYASVRILPEKVGPGLGFASTLTRLHEAVRGDDFVHGKVLLLPGICALRCANLAFGGEPLGRLRLYPGQPWRLVERQQKRSLNGGLFC